MLHIQQQCISSNEGRVALSAQSLTVRYGNTTALENVGFEIPKGVCCAIVGPNGSGKSTLVRCALGLVKPAQGTLAIFGGSYSAKVHRVAYMPQRSEVDWDFPVTVFDAVLMGIEKVPPIWSQARKRMREQVLNYLESVGMREFWQRPLKQLSGGQQQRVFFARALAQNAELYLMDEPFSGVDAKTEQALIRLVQEICNQGKTVIVVHHKLQSVPEIFNHILLLNRTSVACGSVESVWTAENLQSTFSPRGDGCVVADELAAAKSEGFRYVF
jgi:manganese/zinc/iron transport system ATP- binding protein